jgi:hypothetical protein
VTKPVRDRSQHPRESSKAWASWQAYRAMPPGERGIDRLAAQFKEQKRRHQSDPEGTPPPPTTNPATLRLWSSQFHWQARLAVEAAELDAARRAEQRRAVEQQARENALLQQQVGAGALGICALALNDVVDPASGAIRHPVPVAALPQLMRAGAELLQLSTLSPTQIIGGDQTSLETILRESDDQTRQAIVNGLRAALAWKERHGGL